MIYSSASATRDPQAVVDQHIIGASTGRCLACGTLGCEQCRAALAKLAAWQRLPRRTPGATRPELVGARQIQPV